MEEKITIEMTLKEAKLFSWALSDISCFIRGYRVGVGENTDNTAFIDVHCINKLNTKIKDKIDF